MTTRTANVVRKVVNKKIVPSRPSSKGNPGYDYCIVVRVLVYAVLSGIFTNKGLVTHLENNPTIARILGLKTIPHRKSISRWKKQKWILLGIVIENLGKLIQEMVTNKLVIFDSAPIPDEKDSDAKTGFNSRGPFIGFKIHLAVNQFGMPLKAIFSTGNRHDSPFLRPLLKGLKKMWFGLGDSGYDSKPNRKAINSKGGIALIDYNMRNSKTKPKRPWLLKVMRFIVEETNSNLKESVLQRKWTRVKGFDRKASLLFCGVIAMQVMAIDNLLKGRGCEWMKVSEYR